MNGHACCVFGVCCPPGSAEQLEATTDAMLNTLKKSHPKLSRDVARSMARRFLDHHNYFRDLAEMVEHDSEVRAFKE